MRKLKFVQNATCEKKMTKDNDFRVRTFRPLKSCCSQTVLVVFHLNWRVVSYLIFILTWSKQRTFIIAQFMMSNLILIKNEYYYNYAMYWFIYIFIVCPRSKMSQRPNKEHLLQQLEKGKKNDAEYNRIRQVLLEAVRGRERTSAGESQVKKLERVEKAIIENLKVIHDIEAILARM